MVSRPRAGALSIPDPTTHGTGKDRTQDGPMGPKQAGSRSPCVVCSGNTIHDTVRDGLAFLAWRAAFPHLPRYTPGTKCNLLRGTCLVLVEPGPGQPDAAPHSAIRSKAPTPRGRCAAHLQPPRLGTYHRVSSPLPPSRVVKLCATSAVGAVPCQPIRIVTTHKPRLGTCPTMFVRHVFSSAP